MPKYDGTGPVEAGMMGRRGRCRGQGFGRISVGYGAGGAPAAAANMRGALQERSSFLRAELARIESLIAL